MSDTPKIIRKLTVREMTGLSDSGIDRHEQGGNFPKRFKIGKRNVGWYESEVVAWIAQRRERARRIGEQIFAGQSQEQIEKIRQHVSELPDGDDVHILTTGGVISLKQLFAREVS